MKDLREKIKICATCKNREFNPNIGIVCSLTKEKPTFEDECEVYVADETQLTVQAERVEELEKEKNITGWLAFFLWVGIGLEAFILFILELRDALIFGVNPISLLYLIVVSTLFITAVSAIVAFYKRKSNAVALANTYIAMLVFDGFMFLIISLILSDGSFIQHLIRQFIWGGLCFVYLRKSQKIELIMPTSSRTWGNYGKILLTIYMVALALYVFAVTHLYCTYLLMRLGIALDYFSME